MPQIDVTKLNLLKENKLTLLRRDDDDQYGFHGSTRSRSPPRDSYRDSYSAAPVARTESRYSTRDPEPYSARDTAYGSEPSRYSSSTYSSTRPEADHYPRSYDQPRY